MPSLPKSRVPSEENTRMYIPSSTSSTLKKLSLPERTLIKEEASLKASSTSCRRPLKESVLENEKKRRNIIAISVSVHNVYHATILFLRLISASYHIATSTVGMYQRPLTLSIYLLSQVSYIYVNHVRLPFIAVIPDMV